MKVHSPAWHLVIHRALRWTPVLLLLMLAVGMLIVAGRGQPGDLAGQSSESVVLGPVDSHVHPQAIPRTSIPRTGRTIDFVENRGQWNNSVRFVARDEGLVAGFAPNAITLALEKPSSDGTFTSTRVDLTFEGASSAATLEEQEPTGSVHHFFVGNDPSRWRQDVPGYGRLRYHNVYAGVDLDIRERSGSLEYDLLIAPGSDVDRLAVRCSGVEGLRINEEGALELRTPLGILVQRPPEAWLEEGSGARRPVPCRFRKIDESCYGFEVSGRDLQLALVVDPVLDWSSFLGGMGNDWSGGPGAGICVDSAGFVTVAGRTASFDFPTSPGAYDVIYNGFADVFVSRLSADGSSLVWSTFLGGSFQDDEAFAVALGPGGTVTVAGRTKSSNFPTTSGAYDVTGPPSSGVTSDAFAARLSANGDSLLWSTFLGGSGNEEDWALDLDASGHVTLGGWTRSADFPTTEGAYDRTYNGGGAFVYGDAYIARFDPSLSGNAQLLYATFLGGAGDELVMDLDLNEEGDVFAGGLSRSLDFPVTHGAFDTLHAAESDAFVVRLRLQGSGMDDLIYSTVLGGAGREQVSGIQIDAPGIVTIGGWTMSPDFPTTPGAYDSTFNDGVSASWDTYVGRLRLDGNGSADLLYSTYLGGSDFDGINGLQVGKDGVVFVVGPTFSANFPVTPNAFDPTFNGGGTAPGADAFLAVLDPRRQGSRQLVYSTFLGGATQIDNGFDLALDHENGVLVTGVTGSSDFPTTSGAYDMSFGGGQDAFVTRFRDVSVDADVDREALESTVRLEGNAPNPFCQATSIPFVLPKPARVTLDIYDVAGRRVRRLADTDFGRGPHAVTWDGRGAGGAVLGSGVYLYELRVDGQFVQCRKAMRLR